MSQSKLDVMKRKYIRRNKQRKRWILAVIFLSVATMAITTIQLRSNVSAMSGKRVCGLEEHEHTESCYTLVPEAITCGIEEHTHGEDCYEDIFVLDCDINHEHEVSCYKEVNELTCNKQEHTHTDACITPAHRELTCGVSAHVHSDACYEKDDSFIDAIQSTLGIASASEVVAENDDYAVTLQYDKREDAKKLPNVVTREITEEDEEYADLLAQAQEELGTKAVYARFFEITPLQKNMEEGEPTGDTTVKLTLSDYQEITEDTSVNVLHFGADTPTEMESEVLDEQALTVTFTTDGFSVFGIVYTVDFHYDGLEYNLAGGSALRLSSLLDALAIENANGRISIYDIENVAFSNESLVKVEKVEADTSIGSLKEANGMEVHDEDYNDIVYSIDWVLLSLQPFESEEELVLTLRDGTNIAIKVTDAMGEYPYPKGEEFLGRDTRLDGIRIDLFDYGPEKLDYVANSLDNDLQKNTDWQGTTISYKSDNGFNGTDWDGSGINQGHALKFYSYGKTPWENNSNTSLDGNVRLGANNFTSWDYAAQGIVEPLLGEDGYPVLRQYDTVASSNESLAYLFDENEIDGAKTVYPDVTTLFQFEDEKFFYNSNDNYAYFNPNISENPKKQFVLCDTFPEEGSDWGVGFFPFDPFDSSHRCIHGKNISWCDGAKANNGNAPGYYNHHFGMKVEGTFYMISQYDRKGRPIEFNFSGDDDMWVFVDDVLVMDVGGVHNPLKGKINFTEGYVEVDKAIDVGTIITTYNSGGSTRVDENNTVVKKKESTEEGKTTHIKLEDIFAAQGKTWSIDPDVPHTLKVFYMERGGCYSNLAMDINLPFARKVADVSFTKYDEEARELPANHKWPHALPGAEYTLYTDPACTSVALDPSNNPYVAISAEDGSVLFKDIPVDETPLRNFFMKETKAPIGYEKDDTVYRVKCTPRGSSIKDNAVEEAADSKGLEKPESDSITEMYNAKDTISLTLVKTWPAGRTTPDSATFELHRAGNIASQGDEILPQTCKVRLVDQDQYNPQELWSIDNVYVGDEIYIKNYELKYNGMSSNPEETPATNVNVVDSSGTVIDAIGIMQTTNKRNEWNFFVPDPATSSEVSYLVTKSHIINGVVTLKLESKSKNDFNNINPSQFAIGLEHAKKYNYTYTLGDEVVQTIELHKDDDETKNFTETIENLEHVDGKGEPWNYYFKEIDIPEGYTPVFSGLGDETHPVSETTVIEVQNVTGPPLIVEKQWVGGIEDDHKPVLVKLFCSDSDDKSDPEEIVADFVDLGIYYTTIGETGGYLLNSENNWRIAFEGMPNHQFYWIEEQGVVVDNAVADIASCGAKNAYYAANKDETATIPTEASDEKQYVVGNVGTLGVVNIIETKEFSFAKTWFDASGNKREWNVDEAISVTLHRYIGDNVESGTLDESFEQTFTIKHTNDADAPFEIIGPTTTLSYVETEDFANKFHFANLAKFDPSGKECHYTLSENEAPDVQYVSDVERMIETGKDYITDGQFIINRDNGGYQLPESGGMGTTMFKVSGMVITLAALAMLARKKH